MFFFFFKCYGGHRVLPVLTNSFPTRRSSDLFYGLGFDGHPDLIADIVDADMGNGWVAAADGHWASAHDHEYPAVTGKRADGRDLIAEWKKRSEEHTSELQSLMRSSYAVFCLKKKNNLDY